MLFINPGSKERLMSQQHRKKLKRIRRKRYVERS